MSDLASLLFQQIRQAEDESDRVYEVVIGIVTDNHDPQKLGRVKVKLPTISRDDSTWWAPIAMPGAGNQRGWFFLPEIDDEVLIGFEHGDIARPIVLGALWNGKDQPPLANPDGDNAQRAVVSRGGSRILFDDKDDQIVIEDGGGVGRITLDAKHNKIVVEALIGDACVHCKDDLVIQAKEVEMVAKATMAITSTSGNVKGNANAITIKGTAMLRVQGAQIGINDNGAKALDGSVVAQPADGEPVHAPPPLAPPPPAGAPGTPGTPGAPGLALAGRPALAAIGAAALAGLAAGPRAILVEALARHAAERRATDQIRLHGAEARVSQRALPAAAPAARAAAVDHHATAARPVTHAQVAGHRPFDNVVPDTGDLELELLGLSDGPAPAGTAELATEDGSVTRSTSLAGASRRADGSAVVAFKDVKPGRYVVDVIPAKGARYRVIAPIAILKHDLRTSSAPGRSLAMQSVRVVYDDAPTKPATDKHVDLKLGDAWLAVATNEVGALVIADTAAPRKKGKKPTGKPAPGRRGGLRAERPIKAGAPPASSGEPLWFAVNRTDLELAIAEHPPEVAGDPPEDARQTSAIAPAPSAATGVDDRAVRIRRIKLSLPLTVNFASLLDAQRFLARHPMRVDVDGMPVTCAVTIASPTRWQIDFPIGPGTHQVIVTSQELEPQGPIQPRRTIYFAREVTVGFGPPKLVAMMSAGPLTMMGNAPASATPSGHGPAKVGAASVEPSPPLDARKSPR